MAEYEKVFNNPYPNGWEDLPSENTPITSNALQEHTDAIEHIEQYLEDNPIEKGGTDVQWNQIQESGTKIAEITIGEKSQDVFAPSGGGSSSDDLVGTKAEFEAIKDSLPDGSAFDTIDEHSQSRSGFGFIDTNNLVDKLNVQGGSYIARENLWAIAKVTAQSSSTSAVVFLNDIPICASNITAASIYIPFPVKIGDIVTTRNTGIYEINFYKMI